jgi:hypothetical protein
MKWHNSRAPWAERKDRHRKNAARKAAYRTDPEFWRNKTRKWREDHPEQAKFFAQKTKERYWASPWRKAVIAAKGRAAKKRVAFDLTVEWAQERWTGFCELTGIPFQPRFDAPSGIFSPSLDRIVPEKGYTQANCRFVLMGINGLKRDGTDEEMYLVVKSLIYHQNLAPARLKPQKPETDFAVTTL